MWHLHFWHWLMDFTGVNNGDDSFGTHMYNFWSGFGGNISVLALLGTILGVYRHNLKRFDKLNPLRIVRKKEGDDAADS
ncbi:MAG TPA: hypothetical protein VFH39_04760 [Candidatus Saccharimonadales bacterium]|nr:hypothetical protein [Candidatus Saccharimonadales bacterium]